MPGEMRKMLGNTKLVNYGIQNDYADLRYHVGVVVKKVFVFMPEKARDALSNGEYRKVCVRMGKIVTATGYLVPYTDISGCRMVDIPGELYDGAGFYYQDSPKVKGEKAERLVRKMIVSGLLSTILTTVSVDDENMQVQDIDLVVLQAREIQVKCDWRAGPTELGGTGYLFLQDAECNPLRIY